MSRLRDLFGLSPHRPATRLTEAEALGIARAAIAGADQPLDPVPPLMVADVTARPSGIEWTIATATRGAGATVRIADADGRVVDIVRHHGR